jgi:hypothetical protein
MAVQPLADEERERSLVQPLADQMMQRIRQRDPEASFSLAPGVDDGIWLLDAHVDPHTRDDWDFAQQLVALGVDFQREHGVTVAPIQLTRGSADAA